MQKQVHAPAIGKVWNKFRQDLDYRRRLEVTDFGPRVRKIDHPIVFLTKGSEPYNLRKKTIQAGADQSKEQGGRCIPGCASQIVSGRRKIFSVPGKKRSKSKPPALKNGF